MNRKILTLTVSALALAGYGTRAFADDVTDAARIAALESRIEALEETNRQLLEYLRLDESGPGDMAVSASPSAPSAMPAGIPMLRHDNDTRETIHSNAAESVTPGANGGRVGLNSRYSFEVLDHAENVNTTPRLILDAIADGSLDDRVTFGGAITVLANYQQSNSNTKFGWLMRHPTSANQIGEEVSEFVVHAASLQTTARFTDNITGFMELLYNPEQSFGAGTITDLNRNQIQMRRAFVMIGNLDQSPWYAALGKMYTPFGLNDTVSPFTNSTVWHSFAGLAYGGLLGYSNNGFHLRAMAIQGGAQFRAANTPVEGTNIPSRVNNFAIDANYTADLAGDDTFMVGASYEHGSPYCQAYPVFHFNPCQDNNPAWSIYSRLNVGDFTFIGEYAQTTDVWPGSAVPAAVNPALAVFEAQETVSFGLGGRYALDVGRDSPLLASFEFSRFRAGDDGAPWERQDQWVGGLSYYVTPSVNFFGEYIHTEGWVPLNFLSGGNLPAGATWSERDAQTDVITLGIQAAF